MSAVSELIKSARSSFMPPPRLSLSQWAEEYGHLSAESSADPGKWRNLPYQVGIMDAITDPRIERVTVMKSARVGYTKIIGHAIGYHIHYDPCPIMVVQPTEADAEGYSKEEIAPMIRDTPVLSGLVADPKARDSGNTILQKQFPGGTLSLVGANSPRGFRRVSRRVVIFDEVDGYPPSAGPEGDQIRLGIKRAEYYWNRKIIAGSTPTIADQSRIETMFEDSDKRYFHVPCPTCGEFQVLKWANLKWPKDNPERAHFVCIFCEKPIDHREKRRICEKGNWIAEKPFSGHAGFHIWAAYSFSPNSSWAHLAKEYLECRRMGQEAVKTFHNVVLGEVWREKGEVPEWEKIYRRRESYRIGIVPAGGYFLTAGADVQKDRIEVEIKAWGPRESWSVDYRVLSGDTADVEGPAWRALDELLLEQFESERGISLPVRALAVDTGFRTQEAYTWARKHPSSRVFPVKGRDDLPSIVGAPTTVDVKLNGKRVRRGVKLWPVGTNVTKSELYSKLRMEKPIDPSEPIPLGYMHFPEYGEEYFKMLTAEQQVEKTKRGYKTHIWEKIRDRNEALDCNIYARAAAFILGIDRYMERHWEAIDPGGSVPKPASPPPAVPAAPATKAAATAAPSAPRAPRPRAPKRSSFWNR